MAISFDPTMYGYSQGTKAADTSVADKISDSASGLSSESSEEELKAVLKDFESYFLEQIFKDAKETFTWKNKDEEDSIMSQYTDFFMDKTIETLADDVLDKNGESLTQQLYEQMKRNYNIE